MGWMRRKQLQKRKNESQNELLDEIDFAGLEEWSGDEQKEPQELMTEYVSISAIGDMDLDKTSLVKHSIRSTYNTPFKDH